MPYAFDNQTPIYLQIMEAIKTSIISGKYALGQKLPSVRDFAIEFDANPNTVQKALFELEQASLIVTERTSGKYVTNDSGVIEKVRLSKVDKIIEDFLTSMSKIGIDREEAEKLLSKKEIRWKFYK